MIFDGVNSTMMFSVISLFYMISFAIIFSIKKKIRTLELSLFKGLIITNIISLLVECSLLVFMATDSELIYFALKVYNCCIFTYVYIMTFYTFIVGNNVEKIDMYKPNFIIYSIMYFICIVVLLICPISLNDERYMQYSFGPSVMFLFAIIAIMVNSMFIEIIIKRKQISRKKVIPIILLILLLAINAITQFIFPQLLLANSIISLVTFIMYFTIENPDIKMIDQLEVAREQADKANSAKTDFLSSMSHEIRTPLNAIVGFSDCIMDAENLGEAKENAKDIVNASQTLLEIVNGILDISKIEAGKIEIVNSKYNAPETFLELAKLITPRMNEKGLEFTYNIAPDLPETLFGDHANLKKIVTNLLSNACKYTDKGFVHYEVSCINTHNVSKLIISVEDSGRGIKKDSVDKLFTRFQRLEEDRNTTIEGTGLGLAITKQLIELMGGRIILHTIYGQGSKFTVVLNQKITQPDIDAVKKIKTTLDLTNVRIMLVDDTPLNLKVASKLLERYNANQIVTCSSGFECLDRIKRGEVYDLILLDDMMPKMSGVETLKQLKQIPGFNIPTVALTANAISGMREKYLADGFDDFLAKPIEKDQMIQVINQLLGRSVTEDIKISQNDITNVSINTPNIRADIVPNVAELTKNVTDRKRQAAEDEANRNNPDVIPVEDNIEELLGSELDMNYVEKTKTDLKLEPIKINHIEDVEVLDEPVLTTIEPVSVQEVKPIETIPVVDISTDETLEKVENNSEVYDRSYLEKNGADINHALELLGDMDMYNMTISDFMKEVEAKWDRIVQYKNQNNMPDYAIEVHSLKSDCKYLGFMSLADVAYEHELKSKENDSNFVNENFARLESEYKKVLEIAKTYVEHNPVE